MQDRFILFGEWMYAQHSVHYRQLPHYFFEFDIYDKEDEVFLSLERRLALLDGTNIETVPVVHRGAVTRDQLWELIGPSRFDSRFENPSDEACGQSDGRAVSANGGGRCRDRAGEIRASRVRGKGEAEHALATSGDGAQHLERRGEHLVMTWNEQPPSTNHGVGWRPAVVSGDGRLPAGCRVAFRGECSCRARYSSSCGFDHVPPTPSHLHPSQSSSAVLLARAEHSSA